MRLSTRIAVTLVAALLLISVRAARADDLFAVLNKTPELSTLVKLIEAAGLTDDLKTAPTLTLLAPTNEAFAKVPKETLDELMKPENKAKLRSLLLYHALGQKLMAQDVGSLPVGTKGPSVAGPALTLTSVDPPTVNGVARIIKTDIMADNGVIHEIDAVLMPPMKTPKPAPAAPVMMEKGRVGEAMVGTESLMALVEKLPELSSFAKILKETGLAESLAKRGPITLFAPTNAALDKMFNAKTPDALEYLKQRGEIETLLYPTLARHLVIGAYAAADLAGMDGQTLPTLSRGTLLKITGGSAVKLNGIPVVKADIAAKNGILHIIDSVLPK